jgi:hypothetical protein
MCQDQCSELAAVSVHSFVTCTILQMEEKGQCLDVLWDSQPARKDDCEAEITLLYPGVGSLLMELLQLCSLLVTYRSFHESFHASLKRE